MDFQLSEPHSGLEMVSTYVQVGVTSRSLHDWRASAFLFTGRLQSWTRCSLGLSPTFPSPEMPLCSTL